MFGKLFEREPLSISAEIKEQEEREKQAIYSEIIEGVRKFFLEFATIYPGYFGHEEKKRREQLQALKDRAATIEARVGLHPQFEEGKVFGYEAVPELELILNPPEGRFFGRTGYYLDDKLNDPLLGGDKHSAIDTVGQISSIFEGVAKHHNPDLVRSVAAEMFLPSVIDQASAINRRIESPVKTVRNPGVDDDETDAYLKKRALKSFAEQWIGVHKKLPATLE